jgi:DNA-binding transcriptional MocR family regulator
MDWLPALSEWSGPLYLRIADALAADIAGGRLRRGEQMPTQRALADALGIDLTTVTRAYGEARRRGLIEAQVGRGTFVSETTARAPAHIPVPVKIDLSMNLPPQPVEANLDRRIAQGLAAIEHEASFSAYLNYQRPGGSDEERALAARWLRPRVPHASAERLVIYPGNQAILFNALLSLTSPGDVVLTEALTFPGVKAAAERLRLRLVGVAMDQDGIRPDALKAACKQHKPKAGYLVPTLHNPTTATLPPERRTLIADIIRKHGLVLIEDDAYGLLEPKISPLASLIPERTYLAVGLSKCLAPALRVSFLLAPDDAAEQRMTNNLQATMLMTAPLMATLVAHWLKTGIAAEIIAAIRNEAMGRQQLARRILKGVSYAARPTAHHLWLPLPPRWGRAEFLAQVLRHGLAVVGDDAFTVGDALTPAVRISLGAARNRAELAQALQCLADVLKSDQRTGQIV